MSPVHDVAPNDPLVLSTREGYDRWAEIYDGETNPLIALEEPEVDRLLGEVVGLDVVDVGCGTGRHSLRLAARGARVTGVDFSDAVCWVVHDLTELPLPLQPRSFDRVLCALVVDHIADLAAFFSELGRLCRRDGRIVVTVMHPALMLRGLQARFHDPASGRETRPASVPNRIADYVNGVIEAGLRIVAIGERDVDGELARRAPRAEKYLGWPMLLWLELAP